MATAFKPVLHEVLTAAQECDSQVAAMAQTVQEHANRFDAMRADIARRLKDRLQPLDPVRDHARAEVYEEDAATERGQRLAQEHAALIEATQRQRLELSQAAARAVAMLEALPNAGALLDHVTLFDQKSAEYDARLQHAGPAQLLGILRLEFLDGAKDIHKIAAIRRRMQAMPKNDRDHMEKELSVVVVGEDGKPQRQGLNAWSLADAVYGHTFRKLCVGLEKIISANGHAEMAVNTLSGKPQNTDSKMIEGLRQRKLKTLLTQVAAEEVRRGSKEMAEILGVA